MFVLIVVHLMTIWWGFDMRDEDVVKKRPTKGDKKAKVRYSRYKKGGPKGQRGIKGGKKNE